MSVIAGSRNGEIVDVAHCTRYGDFRNTIVVDPRPELQCMCVGERVPVAGITLQTELELRLETELLRDRDLPSHILEEPWCWATGLGVRDQEASQHQRAACTKPGQLSLPFPPVTLVSGAACRILHGWTMSSGDRRLKKFPVGSPEIKFQSEAHSQTFGNEHTGAVPGYPSSAVLESGKCPWNVFAMCVPPGPSPAGLPSRALRSCLRRSA